VTYAISALAKNDPLLKPTQSDPKINGFGFSADLMHMIEVMNGFMVVV
jgi:hypothetical protein